MKNRNFIKMLLFLSFGALIVACSSDDEPNINDETNISEKVLASYEQTINGTAFQVNFIYNESKELEMVTSSFGDITFEFSEGRLVKTSDPFAYFEYIYSDQGYLIEKLNYQDDNEDNTIGLFVKNIYTYNSSGQVERMDEIFYYEEEDPDESSEYELFSYQESDSKNPVSSKSYYSINGEAGVLYREKTYVYDISENPFYLLGIHEYMVTNDWVPEFATNNLLNSEINSVSGAEDNNLSIANEYDEDGDIINATMTISRPNSDDYIYSVVFTYKTI